MGLLRLILGWNWKVRRLRKEWDRTREKSLTKKGDIRRLSLEKLDDIEHHLRILEEDLRLTRRDKERFAKEIEIDIAEVRGLLEMKSGELRPRETIPMGKEPKKPEKGYQGP